LNLHFFFTYTLYKNPFTNDRHCYPKEEYVNFMFRVWTWIDLAMAFGIPFVLLVSGNLTIWTRLRSSDRFRTKATRRSTSRNLKTRWTAITLALNTSFIVLVLPSVVFGIGQVYWFPSTDLALDEQRTRMMFVSTIVFMLMYINCAINFVFYILIGSRFRAELKSVLSSCFKWCKCW